MRIIGFPIEDTSSEQQRILFKSCGKSTWKRDSLVSVILQLCDPSVAERNTILVTECGSNSENIHNGTYFVLFFVLMALRIIHNLIIRINKKQVIFLF